jgi:hypothetical protein
LVFSSFLFSYKVGNCQSVDKNLKFSVGKIVVSIARSQSVKTPDGVCESLSDLKIMNNGKQVYHEKICSVELDDVKVLERGYLTVVENYSAPVGWSQFYVFDFCKMRLILTKRLQESTGLPWEDFIEMNEQFKAKYVEKIVSLN